MKFLNWLERRLETGDDPMPTKADAVIGFDFGFAKDGLSASLQSRAIARKCLEIFKEGVAKNIVLSGGVSVRGVTAAQAMAAEIAGDPAFAKEKLFIEKTSRKTFGNARCSLEIIRKQGWKTVIIVAQQWHARRVRATLRKMWGDTGIEFSVVKARSGYEDNFGVYGFPVGDNFLLFAIYDTLSFLYFKLKGYC